MDAVEALNKAFQADQDAIQSLLKIRVPCNLMLANAQYVQVLEEKSEHVDQFSVGAIGLVNAVLAAHGLPLVACRWVPLEDGSYRLVGFCEYVQ